MAEISNKDRMKIPRQIMPEQNPDLRRTNFKEVNLGFTEELAKLEALRCLQCPKPVCIDGCPVGVKINDFVKLYQKVITQEQQQRLRKIICFPQFAVEFVLKKNNVKQNVLLEKKVNQLQLEG